MLGLLEPVVSVKNTRRRDGDIDVVVVDDGNVVPARDPDPGELPVRAAGERVREGVVAREGVLDEVGERNFNLGEAAAGWLRKIPAVGVAERDDEADVGGRATVAGRAVNDEDEDETAMDGGGAVAVSVGWSRSTESTLTAPIPVVDAVVVVVVVAGGVMVIGCRDGGVMGSIEGAGDVALDCTDKCGT